jgi:uncharacterized protein with GYD domain
MAKFLLEATYTTEGVRGLLKDGGSARRAVVQTAVKKVGGKLEAFYFGFGGTDVFVLIDGVDTTTAAAIALHVAASGAVHTKTTVLLTPEDVDKACKTSIKYKAPGE